MNQSMHEFLHDFRQKFLADAEANRNFQIPEFMEAVSGELSDAGLIEGFEFCHYRGQRGTRVDGYWFTEEEALDLFVADFDSRENIESLTETEVKAAFNRLTNFFVACVERDLYRNLEETSPEYGLARQIKERQHAIGKVNFYLLSDRSLSTRVKTIEDDIVSGNVATFHIWDISRLHRQSCSMGQREILNINFLELLGSGVPCLPAHLGSSPYQAYLVVMPAMILSDLYDQYGARLLEQNVRCFLQARGKVNKGIRATILNEPEMFFAYNNGITATAQSVETESIAGELQIHSIKDLQIVNGGQTTASLFHTKRSDKVSLDKIFVQMKLSVIQAEESEQVVPRISEYANTQNRINAADFFSNHPFHTRMEQFSRRIWAPAQPGMQRETKWFYERARGQYADAQSRLTPGEKKRFQAEFPRHQMFTKTDLAKFENVWDEKPTFVNLGAQKNFAQYAARIGKEWDKDQSRFNEFYYKRAMSRAMLFRKTEKLVSAQAWYSGGYRANIVAYTLALLGFYCEEKEKSIDFMQLWDQQFVPDAIEKALATTSKLVHNDIIHPEVGISNVTEWCKKEFCWIRLQKKVNDLDTILPSEFKLALIKKNQVAEAKKDAQKTQNIDNGIEAQKRVIEISGEKWRVLMERSQGLGLLTPKETGILKIAAQIPHKIPSEKQCMVLIQILRKVELEGIVVVNK